MAKVEQHIYRSLQEVGSTSDFVALGAITDSTDVHHAGLVIHYEGKLYAFHYDGQIAYKRLTADYFHKITDAIDPNDVPAFIARCEVIQESRNIKFGHFYSGEAYDNYGYLDAKSDVGERMTCVGFCLAVLKGFLGEDYLAFKDWDSTSDKDSTYLDSFCKRHEIDPDSIKSAHRRIVPVELLTSGFFSSLPINKKDIESKKIEVEAYLLTSYNSEED